MIRWLRDIWTDQHGDVVENLAVLLLVAAGAATVFGALYFALLRAGISFEQGISGVSIER